jgi:TRAP-type C4-dicarboxylate transport system permease small subunit
LATTDLGAQQVTYIVKSTGAAWALALATTVIVLGGLGILVPGTFSWIYPHAASPQPSDGLIAMGIVALIFGSLSMFGIVAMMIRVLSRFIGPPAVKKVEQPDHPKLVITPAASRAQGLPPFAVRDSVTENTTRTFDHPSYREPASRE